MNNPSKILLSIIIIFCIECCSENHSDLPVKILTSTKIPEDAFFVPGSTGGVCIYVDHLHPHLNMAYLFLYDPVTGSKIDSGKFFVVGPKSEFCLIPTPEEQFVKYEKDTIWVKSETGKVVCWMQKSIRD